MKPLLLLIAASVWLGAVVYYGRRLVHGGVSFGLRAVVIGLRGLSLLGLLILLFYPVKARETRVRRPLHLIFLLDDSSSMALPAADTPGSRLERARRVLFETPGGLVDEASRRGFEPRVLALSDQGYIASAEECSASAETSDLAGGLNWARGFGRDQDIAAVVMLTDGRHTAAGDPVRSASATDFPVFAVGLGATQAVADLAVTQLSIPPSVPSEEEFEAEATVDVGTPLETLVRGEFLVDGSSPLPVEATIGSASRRVRFTGRMKAGEPGPHRVTFRVEPLATEPVKDNNQRSRMMIVEKARFRVLVLAGRPSWEFRFLRRSIEEGKRLRGTYLFPRGENGSILLRDKDENGEGPEKEGIYPDRPLSTWTALLSRVDSVIVQNLAGSALDAEWADALEAWLGAEGHALIFLGGDQAYGAGGYAGSSLSDLLPVRCGQANDRRMKEYVLRVPQNTGGLFAYHPFGRFAFDLVPPVLAVHRFAGLKPGSDVLLEAVSASGERLPALVVHRAGLGFVAAAGWDSVWRWQALGRDPDLLGRFWRTLILFFLTGEESGPAALHVSDQGLRVGQPIRLWMYLSPTLLGEGLPDRVRLLLSGESISQRPVYLFPSPEEPSRYQGAFSVQSPGSYVLSYEVAGVQWEKGLWVEADSHERDYVSQDAELLARIAAAGGGESISPVRAGELLDMIRFEPGYELTAHYTFVGRLPWVIFVLVGLFAGEWIVRRWHMLP